MPWCLIYKACVYSTFHANVELYRRQTWCENIRSLTLTLTYAFDMHILEAGENGDTYGEVGN